MSIQNLRDALNQKFLERPELVDGMLVALLSKEPLLMIGPPGTAKSEICSAVCNAFSGEYFSWMMNKLTVPEEIFGPFSLKALENDQFSRVIDGKLPTADIAFLDEVFKSGSAILNANLTILNERIFYNDGKPVPVPLQTLYAASNELPQAEELSALYDRFVLRYFVDRLQSDVNALELFSRVANNTKKVAIPTISKADLEKEQKAAMALPFAKETLSALVELRKATEEAGIQVSDRKWVQSVSVLKAFAYLNSATEVQEEHLEIMGYIIWNTNDQRREARRLAGKFSGPMMEEILTITDGVNEVLESLRQKKIEGAEAFSKIKHAKAVLEKMKPDSSKLKQAIAFVKEVQKKVAVEELGIEI